MNFWKKISYTLIRSGYTQAAHDLERHGMMKEAQSLRNDARLVGALHWGTN